MVLVNASNGDLIRAKRNGRPVGEKTPPQVITTTIGARNELLKHGLGTYKPSYTKVRIMRKDPTIAFARWIAVAPVLSSEWSIMEEDDAPEGAKEFIERQILPIKNPLVRSSFYGCMDYGWQSYEKVFKKTKEGKIGIKKIKPLLPDYTTILVDKHGTYMGLRQNNPNNSFLGVTEVNMHRSKTLSVAFDVEGTDFYGQSSMEVVELVYDLYNNVSEGAARYDNKVAGSHWVVHYPEGRTMIDGVEKDNYEVANDILSTLKASGSIAVPRIVSAFVTAENKAENAWEIELKSDTSTASGSFNDRMRYYDSLKVRSFGLPERSVLEGQYGTKAESEQQAEAAVLNTDARHIVLVEYYNKHLIDQLLMLNWGPDAIGTVKIEASPIVDKQRKQLADIYLALIKNPKGYTEAFNRIDMVALENKLQIPLTDESKEDFEEDVQPTLPQNPFVRQLTPEETQQHTQQIAISPPPTSLA